MGFGDVRCRRNIENLRKACVLDESVGKELLFLLELEMKIY